MKAAFVSALAAVAGNVAYCQADNPDVECSTSRGGRICGTEACNDLVSKLSEEGSVEVEATEDGEFVVIGSDMENGCELTISHDDPEGFELESGYIVEDLYNIVDSCAGNDTEGEWSGSIRSDRGGPVRLLEIYNPAAEGCEAAE